MKPRTKKFLYGLFFSLVFALILIALFNVLFKEAPSCFDGRQNQGETDVDCGGPCLPCALKNIEPLRVSTPEILSLASGRTVILADVENPNSEYGASKFTYVIQVFNRAGRILETIRGSDSIYNSEKRRIFEVLASSPKNNIDGAQIKIENPEWRPIAEIIRPTLSLRGTPATEISTSTIRVRGTVANISSLGAKKVKIIAILREEFGRNIFASQTVLEELPAFSEAPFTVIFPFDNDLAGRTFPTLTQIFISSQ
jgi:hypothetical protein